MSSSPRKRNGIESMKTSPEPMRRASVFDGIVAVKLLVTRWQYLALKGPNESPKRSFGTPRGKALGHATKYRMSPEGAKSGSVSWAALATRRSSRAMPPFQGWTWVGIGFPGLRPGLSHSAPLGPVNACVPDLTSLREIGSRPAIADNLRDAYTDQRESGYDGCGALGDCTIEPRQPGPYSRRRAARSGLISATSGR